MAIVHLCDQCQKVVKETRDMVMIELTIVDHEGMRALDIRVEGEFCSGACTIKWTTEALERHIR